MSSIFGIYSLGLSSLRAAQQGIELAGENIANANTPGYTRRSLELQTGYPFPVSKGILTAGVQVEGLRRQEDRLIQSALEREGSNFAFSSRLASGYQSVELAFGTLDGDTLSSRYAEFANAFGNVAANPTDQASRRSAIDSAAALANQIRSTAESLNEQRRQQDGVVRETVAEVNRLATELARLNKSIAQSETQFGDNSALRDQRNQVVESLRELTGASTYSDERGQILVQLGGGGTLVTADGARPLEIAPAADGTAGFTLSGRDVTSVVTGGELGAAIELRDQGIPKRQTELDSLAADLITRANAITTGGFDIDGNPGVALFDPATAPATGAATSIRINAAVQADPSLLAISVDGAPGNGVLAEQIAALRESADAALGDRSPDQFLTDLYASVGQDVSTASAKANTQQAVVASLFQRRDQVSAVSLDEEAVDLIRYQQTYEASARFMSVLNELLESAVNLAR